MNKDILNKIKKAQAKEIRQLDSYEQVSHECNLEYTLEKISVLGNENPLEERARRGSQLKFEGVMSAVPDVEPPDYDKL